MTDIVEAPAPEQQQEMVVEEPSFESLSFDEQVKDLLIQEGSMNISRQIRDEYKTKIEAEVESTIEKLTLKKKIEEAAAYFTVEYIQQLSSYDPGTYPRECCKSLLIILNKEQRQYQWFKAKQMFEDEAAFIAKLKDFDPESIEQWQITEYLKQLNIEWYNYERLKQYGQTWEKMFVWANSVIAYTLIKRMNPCQSEFTSKLENCQLTEMIDEYNILSFNAYEKNENQFLSNYLIMQNQHGEEKMKEVTLQEYTKNLFGEHFGEKLQTYLTNQLKLSKERALNLKDSQQGFNTRQSGMTSNLKKKIDSTLPDQINRHNRNITNQTDYIKRLTDQNTFALNNMPENDEDFIEYDLKLTDFIKVSTFDAKAECLQELKEDEKPFYNIKQKGDDAFILKVIPKKPITIGALKLGLVQAKDATAKKEGDDAWLEVVVHYNWNNQKMCNKVGTLRFDELAPEGISLEDLENKLTLQRTSGNQTYCGEAFYFQFKVKGDKGKDHFKQFNIDLIKFYM